MIGTREREEGNYSEGTRSLLEPSGRGGGISQPACVRKERILLLHFVIEEKKKKPKGSP